MIIRSGGPRRGKGVKNSDRAVRCSAVQKAGASEEPQPELRHLHGKTLGVAHPRGPRVLLGGVAELIHGHCSCSLPSE